MKLNSLDTSSDDNNDLFCHINVTTDDDFEIGEIQKLFMKKEKVMVVPKSIYTMLIKHGSEMVDILSEKYPEDLMGEDMQKTIKHLKDLDATNNIQ